MGDDRSDLDGDDGEVGFGKPPRSGRFRKGASGNPTGRPKGSKNRPRATGERLRALMLEEAYRPVTVTADGVEVTMPLARAVLRSLAEAAAKGEARAQAAFIRMVSASEAEAAAIAEMLEETRAPETPVIEVRIVDADGQPTGEVLYPYGDGPEAEGGKEPSAAE